MQPGRSGELLSLPPHIPPGEKSFERVETSELLGGKSHAWVLLAARFYSCLPQIRSVQEWGGPSHHPTAPIPPSLINCPFLSLGEFFFLVVWFCFGFQSSADTNSQRRVRGWQSAYSFLAYHHKPLTFKHGWCGARPSKLESKQTGIHQRFLIAARNLPANSHPHTPHPNKDPPGGARASG